MALVLAPLVVASYFAGVPFGSEGVAAAFSTFMMLWLVPHLAWAIHGTMVGLKDIFVSISRPLASSLLALGGTYFAKLWLLDGLTAGQRLAAGSIILGTLYATLLLFAFGQKGLYLDIVRSVRGSGA